MILSSIGIIARPAASSGGLVFQDTFTNADGTELSVHNATWAKVVGTQDFTISGNQLSLGTASGDTTYLNDTPASIIQNGTITLTATIVNGTGIGAIFRAVDSNNFYLMDIGGPVSGKVAATFYKKVSGSFVAIGSQTESEFNMVENTPFSVVVSFIGSVFTATIGETTPIVFDADTTYTAAGKVGLRNGGGNSGLRLVDLFTVTEE